MQTNDPWAGAGHFLPQRHNLNKLGRCRLGYATYKISRLYTLSDKKNIFVFPIYAYVKHMTTGMGPFLAPGALFELTW